MSGLFWRLHRPPPPNTPTPPHTHTHTLHRLGSHDPTRQCFSCFLLNGRLPWSLCCSSTAMDCFIFSCRRVSNCQLPCSLLHVATTCELVCSRLFVSATVHWQPSESLRFILNCRGVSNCHSRRVPCCQVP